MARAENQPIEAIEHLEQAAEMDMDSAATLETLGEVAQEVGQHDRAERAYRALMLLIRRGGKGAALSATEALPDDAGWIHEVKWAATRAQLRLDDRQGQTCVS